MRMSKELTQKTGQFDEIISIIDNARTRALKAVNAELIQMYWNVGEYLSSLPDLEIKSLMKLRHILLKPIPVSKALIVVDSTA